MGKGKGAKGATTIRNDASASSGPASGPVTPLKTAASKSSAAASPGTPKSQTGSDDDDEDEDDELADIDAMRAVASQVQQAPATKFSKAPARVVIPKRGEKDFEPLNETQTIQEKMLRESRQALFDGLSGVRGSSSKHMSHAVFAPEQSPFPQVKVQRGNLFLTLGHSIRPTAEQVQEQIRIKTNLKGKEKQVDSVPALQSSHELLPEEALYLLERGSMQIWKRYGSTSQTEPGAEEQLNETTHGFDGATEMTVMEGFSTFIGMEGLSMERYQVYAGLKRLGYTVQRTPQFLPPRFRKQPSLASLTETEKLPRTHWIRQALTWITSIGPGLVHLLRAGLKSIRNGMRHLVASVLRTNRTSGGADGTSLLEGGAPASSYGALYEKLRIIPSGHSHPIDGPLVKSPPDNASSVHTAPLEQTDQETYLPLESNPYLPFYHVWKPNTQWTSAKWDKGSDQGLAKVPPMFWVGVIDARSVPFPSLPQMTEIFDILPHVPTPYLRKRPNTDKGPRPSPLSQSNQAESVTPPTKSVVARLSEWIASLFSRPLKTNPTQAPQVNTFLSLKQGDRSLVVAVVDCGNVGWTRLGRGGFEDHIMVPPGW